jgi:hypothetical protein
LALAKPCRAKEARTLRPLARHWLILCRHRHSFCSAVQARREWPTRVIQFLRGRVQKRPLTTGGGGKPFRAPLPLRILPQVPLRNQVLPHPIGFGLQRERPLRRVG